MRRLLVTAVLLVTLTGCTPYEVALFNSFDPAGQSKVAAIVGHQSTDCRYAVDTIWPAESRGWFHAVVYRESRYDRFADNPSSSASGCAQLLAVHAWRFPHYGYTWEDRYNARANILVALELYREQGTAPWR